MDWHLGIGVLAGIIQIASIIPYIRDMLKGTTRPNIVSWSLWTLIQIIAIVAQITSGASWSVIIIIAMTFNTSLVVVLAAIGYGYKKYGWIDWTCLSIAILAIVLWQITNEPVVAIVMAVLADIMAALPTIVKAYKDPYSEHLIAWGMVVVASVLSAFSTTIIDIANLLFPIYLIFITGTMTTVIFFRRRVIPKSMSTI